jgi:hypothetical protein
MPMSGGHNDFIQCTVLFVYISRALQFQLAR